MRECDNQTDGTVAAHAQKADVVEKDRSGNACFVGRFAQEGADQHVGAARFVDRRRTETVMLIPEEFELFGDRSISEIRRAADDNARGFAASVGINDLDFFHRHCWKRSVLPERSQRLYLGRSVID